MLGEEQQQQEEQRQRELTETQLSVLAAIARLTREQEERSFHLSQRLNQLQSGELSNGEEFNYLTLNSPLLAQTNGLILDGDGIQWNGVDSQQLPIYDNNQEGKEKIQRIIKRNEEALSEANNILNDWQTVLETEPEFQRKLEVLEDDRKKKKTEFENKKLKQDLEESGEKLSQVNKEILALEESQKKKELILFLSLGSVLTFVVVGFIAACLFGINKTKNLLK